MPGLDGQKMSKSTAIRSSLRRAGAPDQEDPHPCRPIRPGSGAPIREIPEKCPVWQFHVIYSDDSTREWWPRDKSAGDRVRVQAAGHRCCAEGTGWHARAGPALS